MLKSMTGFGSGRGSAGEGPAAEEVVVELRAVNHKFCEVKPRLPRELSSLEQSLVKQVRERVGRGAVDLTVRRQSATATGQVPVVDLELAKEYHRALKSIAEAIGSGESIPLNLIAQQSGVMRMEERGVSLDSAGRAATEALTQALDALIEMRRLEGQALRTDLESRLALIAVTVKEVAALAPRVVDEYRTRLEERVVELNRGAGVEPQRLAQEVAFFAERTDIAEEMTRLSSHLEQFRNLLDAAEPSGRKMDFLVQEMHREVNTTGSKSQHPEISSRVVSLKAELERLREQVQNVE